MFGFQEKNTENYNRIDQMEQDIWSDIAENKKLFAIFFGCSLIGSFIVTGICGSSLSTIFNDESITFSLFLKCAFGSPISYLFTGLMTYALFKACYRFFLITQKNYIQVKEDGENYKQAKETLYGDAHWQTEEERTENFNRSKNFDDITGDILGMDKKGRIYSPIIKPGQNQNKIVFGAAGSFKSVGIVYNDIIQCARRGESVIATDSKGDVYRNTAHIMKDIYGYKIKVLNLKTKELKHSNAWEPLKYVTEEDDIQAEVLANAIILNTENGPMDYWARNELNCLKAAILLVAISPAYEGHRSFSEVVNIISDPSSFNDKFRGLPNDNPAKIAFNIYVACEPKVQGQILNGMANRLSLLTNKYVKEIVAHDEIDLIAPMKEKCIYYIIISDTDTSMRFVASMFFTQIFMLQCDYSDGLSEKQKKKQLSVRYELDEFKNIGQLPEFDVKISTFRSRKISSTIILQGITQLMDLYPNKNHEIILANTTTKILCKAGDMETATYFENMCGTTTTVVNNARYSKGRAQMLDLHNSETLTEGYGQRALLPAAKAMELDVLKIVVCILGEQPIKLNKFLNYESNPVYMEHYEEREPKKRLPKWRKEKEAEQLAKEKRIEEMNKKFKITPEMEEKPEDEVEDEFTKPAKKQKHASPSGKPSADISDSKDTPPISEDELDDLMDEPDEEKPKAVRFDPETGEIFDDEDDNIDIPEPKEESLPKRKSESLKEGTTEAKPSTTHKRTPIHEQERNKQKSGLRDDHELLINRSKFAPESKGNSLLSDLIKKN